MDKLQIAFFFITGFFISRLVIKVQLPEMIAKFLIHKRHVSLRRIILYILFMTALISFFIPNTIAVLTFLPLIEYFRQTYEDSHVEDPGNKVPTVLALALMYGANIGGMGSITATPANGILVSFLAIENVPNSEAITFATWLIWGIPIVGIFLILAWFTLIAFFRPNQISGGKNKILFKTTVKRHPLLNISIFMTLLFFISSFILSIFMFYYPEKADLILIITAGFSIMFWLFMFLVPLRVNGNRQVLITIKDTTNDLPKKGFLFVGISVSLAGILYMLDAERFFADWFNALFPETVPVLVLFIILALITSFSTELLSNTAVQLALFIIVIPLSQIVAFSAIEALLIVTLSCTCAFMSPIATGVNGLAFGGVKHVSFSKMLIAGAVMNIIGAILISIWIRYVTSVIIF